jgi:hypothetical protein
MNQLFLSETLFMNYAFFPNHKVSTKSRISKNDLAAPLFALRALFGCAVICISCVIWLRRYWHSVRYLAAPLFALRALLAARYLLLLLRLLTFDFRR